MRSPVALALLAACGSSPSPARVTAAIVPATANRAVDLLFMVDDSTSTLQYRNALAAAFEPFAARLALAGAVDLHVGVVSSDLGTSGADGEPPAPGFGSGPGSCSGSGMDGELQNHGTVVTGAYITTATPNYTGSLGDAFHTLVDGSETCGFEQHLEAVRRALAGNSANAGFLRPEASLAVVLVGDEDDCSIDKPAFLGDDPALGPRQSFRCTHFGITCDDGGQTIEQMAIPGAKSGCHSNADSPYLTRVADYQTFLEGLKPDPRQVMVGAVVGDPTPFAIELRAPNGSTTGVPAIQHSCQWSDATSTYVADPAVRDAELAAAFDRHAVTSICNADLTGPLTKIAREIDSMMGSPCLTRDIALPADCTAADDAGPVKGFSLVEDAAQCPDGQHLKLQRGGTPVGATTVRCTGP